MVLISGTKVPTNMEGTANTAKQDFFSRWVAAWTGECDHSKDSED